MNKNQKDLNDKISQRQLSEQEINSNTKTSENLLSENNQNMKNLKDLLAKLTFITESLNLDKNTFKEEIKLDELKSSLNQKIFKAIKEIDFFSEQDQIKNGFLKNLENLKNIFEDNVKKIKDKNDLIESSIHNKTEIYKSIKDKIANKYDTVENLNNTAIKLRHMQEEYKSRNKIFSFL